MKEKRDLKSCLFYHVSHLLNHILILVKLTMKYTAPIKVFFLVTLIKSEQKLNHVYIYTIHFLVMDQLTVLSSVQFFINLKLYSLTNLITVTTYNHDNRTLHF